ncbi:MAG: hypothetical protein AB1481_06960 [Candidatus Omnitrophota bacterium]
MPKKIFLSLIILSFLTALIPASFVSAQPAPKEKFQKVLFFYSQGCHACQKVKTEIMPAIDKEFFDKIIVEYLDIADAANFQLLLSLKEQYKCYEKGVPAIFVGEQVIVGYDRIKEELKDAIVLSVERGKFVRFDRLPAIDILKHFRSFGVLALALAGLIDGINPCAFTVIVFFISFLALQGYKKKELIAIGLSFILAVFLTYILIGMGIFRFLYALNKFYLVTKGLYYFIALFCFVLGAFAIYDLWLFRKTSKTEGMVLQLPQKIKNMIHSLIGASYRKDKDESKASISGVRFLKLVCSALLTGFLISLLEGICTGQLYLPTIAFVLKEPALRLRAFGYLLLYNAMFILPLLLVLVFAILGTTQEAFAGFVKKHIEAVKLSMAILFFGLGILILIGA